LIVWFGPMFVRLAMRRMGSPRATEFVLMDTVKFQLPLYVQFPKGEAPSSPYAVILRGLPQYKKLMAGISVHVWIVLVDAR